MALLFSIILAYLIGAIPTGYIFARILRGIDIRQYGSGSTGATNTYRVIGKIPGLVALIIDILKGVVVVTLLAGLFYRFDVHMNQEPYRILLGLLAICGHIWNPFLDFKGGKGVATTIGVLLALSPILFISSFIIWLAIFLTTNYVSLGSILFGISLPIFALLYGKPFCMIVFSVAICVTITYTHRDNMRRLIRGRENKTSLKTSLFKKRK